VRGKYLDLVNFNREVFPEALPLHESEALFRPEHGYGCPDGSAEISDLVRRLESARITRFAEHTHNRYFADISEAAVGIGAGATGVMNCLIPAIRDFCELRDPSRPKRIVVSLPQYSVYDGIVSEHGLDPVYVRARREAKLLPMSEDLEAQIRSRPMAIILTYPTNPAQTTYSKDQYAELERIVELCQQNEVFVVADNVYQDTMWASGACNAEILALSGIQWIVKVFSTSKDRPAHSGLRMGYWCGDPRLQERFFYYSSIQYNTPNSASRCLLGLDLLFRALRLENRELTRGDLDVLGDHIAGWARPLDRSALFDRLAAGEFERQYIERLAVIEDLQRNATRSIIDAASSLDSFSDVVNDQIGNVILLRVNPAVFSGTDHELFMRLLEEESIGVLPANAFGFPVEPGNSWFRTTTIHEPTSVLIERLEQVARNLLQ
jgi:aspartate/methionine/tyrosine aminotransferase